MQSKKMYEHNALVYWSGLALCLIKVRSSRARCPATALISQSQLKIIFNISIDCEIQILLFEMMFNFHFKLISNDSKYISIRNYAHLENHQL